MSAKESPKPNSLESKSKNSELARLIAIWLQLLPGLLENLNCWLQIQPKDQLQWQLQQREKLLFDLIQQIKQGYPDLKIHEKDQQEMEKMYLGKLSTENYLQLIESSQGYKKYKNKLSKTAKRLPQVWQSGQYRELKKIDFPVGKLEDLVFQVMDLQDRFLRLEKEKKALEFRILEPNILNRLQPLINQPKILLYEAELIRQETLAQINTLDQQQNTYSAVVELNKSRREILKFQSKQISYFCYCFALIHSNITTLPLVKEIDKDLALNDVELMLDPSRQKREMADLREWTNKTKANLIGSVDNLSLLLIELGLSPQNLSKLSELLQINQDLLK